MLPRPTFLGPGLSTSDLAVPFEHPATQRLVLNSALRRVGLPGALRRSLACSRVLFRADGIGFLVAMVLRAGTAVDRCFDWSSLIDYGGAAAALTVGRTHSLTHSLKRPDFDCSGTTERKTHHVRQSWSWRVGTAVPGVRDGILAMS